MRPLALAALLSLGGASAPRAADAEEGWGARVELKRILTDRGTDQETTRTTLRLEALPPGPVSLVRLDVPWVDKTQTFGGSPLDEGIGDLTAKLELGPFPAGDLGLKPLVSAIFPTAAQPKLGGGTWQLNPGLQAYVQLVGKPSVPTARWKPQVQQNLSYAGEGKPVDNTSLELGADLTWPSWVLTLTPKAFCDWTKGGATGAVLELENAWLFAPGWRLRLLLGHGLWGTGVPGTYGERVELSLRWAT